MTSVSTHGISQEQRMYFQNQLEFNQKMNWLSKINDTSGLNKTPFISTDLRCVSNSQRIVEFFLHLITFSLNEYYAKFDKVKVAEKINQVLDEIVGARTFFNENKDFNKILLNIRSVALKFENATPKNSLDGFEFQKLRERADDLRYKYGLQSSAN